MTAHVHPPVEAPRTRFASSRLPDLVEEYLSRSFARDAVAPAAVRLRQVGVMWSRPGARALRFEATEELSVDRLAFWWRARFPIAGPLGLAVADELEGAKGRLRVSALGIPLRTKTGPELTVGQAMRYLAELPWVPHAIAHNPHLEWCEVDERTVEVSARIGPSRAAVYWTFDDAGDVVRAIGSRPYPTGRTFVPRLWGGDLGEFATIAGLRVPTAAEVWWDLPDGRFVYWRGRVASVEQVAARPPSGRLA